MTTNQLALIQTFDDAERAARAMSASGFFPDSRQAAQAIVKILAGQELGFGPFASMTGVSIIQGKPAIGANLMAAAIKRTGKYNYRVIEMTDRACEIAFFENGQEVGRSRFTIEDAERAGLMVKDTWKKYPRNLLFARALSNGQRWYCPDVYNGALVYTPEELGASNVDENGVIDAVAMPTPEQAKLAPDPTPEPAIPAEDAAPADITKDLAHLSGIVDSDGNAYLFLPSEKLADKSIGIGKALKANGLTPEKKAEYQTKMNAVKEILVWREKHPQRTIPA